MSQVISTFFNRAIQVCLMLCNVALIDLRGDCSLKGAFESITEADVSNVLLEVEDLVKLQMHISIGRYQLRNVCGYVWLR